MSLAAEAREAVRARPFLLAALRAGVVNYTAAARTLDVDGDEDAVATALRRFAEDLPPWTREARAVRVTMERGVGLAADGDPEGSGDPLLSVGGTALAGDGDLTAVLASGAVDAGALAAVLGRLDAAEVPVDAAGVGDGALVVAVPGRRGVDALRVVEAALAAVPE